ncbi:MAG: chalcone isomerase family protein [Acetobacteraceae bacterium]
MGRKTNLGALALAAGLALGRLPPAQAADLAGVSMPEAQHLDGIDFRLNGIGLRTYSILGIHIYVAGFYLEHPSRDAEAVLHSPQAKLLVIHFVHNVDLAGARKAWQEGFEQNCDAPCPVPQAEIDRFLAAVTPMQAGQDSTLLFTQSGLRITIDGHAIGTVPDPDFSRLILATFIGREPPTPRLKRQLLGME